VATILIVDDDPQLRRSFERLLTNEGHSVETAANGETGIEKVRQHVPDLVIMDVRMPGINGLEAFKEMLKIEPRITVVIMTAYGTTDTAIEATKLGAFDYVMKPFDIPDILEVIEKAINAGKMMRSQVEMDGPPEGEQGEAIVGRSHPMQELYKGIGRSAPTDATILIRGESGTGKELVARAIYQHSLRNTKPFLVINCVAIPETLLESELFGYEKGAFTGAATRRIGKIEQAHGGTVFLDEIGDMPYSIQAKILRLLQERSIERLGGRHPIPIDVRIIAATNRNLEKAVTESKFREDLYYRLKVVTLWVPPLRERKEDIPLLAKYFLNRSAKEMKIAFPGLTREAIAILTDRQWPGNVRELANTIQKALIFNRGKPLDADDVQRISDEDNIAENKGLDEFDSLEFDTALRQWIRSQMEENTSENIYDNLMDFFSAAVIRAALNLTEGNRTHGAKLLGISRPTLIAKIEKHGLKFQTTVSED